MFYLPCDHGNWIVLIISKISFLKTMVLANKHG